MKLAGNLEFQGSGKALNKNFSGVQVEGTFNYPVKDNYKR